MNYYEARAKADGSGWHWTRMNDRVVVPAGACADGTCHHATREEAEDHEAERIQLVLAKSRKALRLRICDRPGCIGTAHYEAEAEGRHFYLCRLHGDDVTWFSLRGTQVQSSV